MSDRMSALADLIETALREYAGEFYPVESWDMDCAAAYVAGRLEDAAWFAVVELPEPDGIEQPTEDENGFWQWDSADVAAFDDGEIHCAGIILEIGEARERAAALLAAADHAKGGGDRG